ncbi:MAG: hypothetical protein NTX50_16800, partial [Candidatus Sumerlaeota bacterium]|nr:hypothetical protein [Candidatus Sumerlaeota bacterium]
MSGKSGLRALAALAAVLALAALALNGAATETLKFAPIEISLNGKPPLPPSAASCGFSLVAASDGPQVAFMARPPQCIVAVNKDERVTITIGVEDAAEQSSFTAEVALVHGRQATAILAAGDHEWRQTLTSPEPHIVSIPVEGKPIRLTVIGGDANAGVRLRSLRLKTANAGRDAGAPRPLGAPLGAPASLP